MEKSSLKLLQAAVGSQSGPVMIDAYAFHRQMAALALASEGETLEQIAASIGLADLRPDRLRTTHEALADALLRPGSAVKSGGSFWMIWPIMVTPEFASQAEVSLGTRVKRLGSAGQGSQNAIAEWLNIQSGGRFHQFEAQLSKEEPVISVTTTSADFAFSPSVDLAATLNQWDIVLSGRLQSGQGPKGISWRRLPFASEDWELLLASGPDSLSKTAQTLAETGSIKPVWGEDKLTSISPFAGVSMPLQGALARSSWKFLVEPGLDLRYMGIELGSTQIPQWISAAEAHLGVGGVSRQRVFTWAAKEYSGPEPWREYLWFVRHIPTGTILYAGSQKP
jgi:hypothetical protein